MSSNWQTISFLPWLRLYIRSDVCLDMLTVLAMYSGSLHKNCVSIFQEPETEVLSSMLEAINDCLQVSYLLFMMLAFHAKTLLTSVCG